MTEVLYILSLLKGLLKRLISNTRMLTLVLFFVVFIYSLYRNEANFQWSEPLRLTAAKVLISGTEAEIDSPSEESHSPSIFEQIGVIRRPKSIVYREILSFPVDTGSTEKRGLIKPNETVDYIFDGIKDQTLDISMTGDRVAMTVLGPNQEPLDESARQVSSWEGSLASTGQYYIRISTTKRGNEAQYQIRVVLRGNRPAVNTVPE